MLEKLHNKIRYKQEKEKKSGCVRKDADGWKTFIFNFACGKISILA
jgi:hypothetical protein